MLFYNINLLLRVDPFPQVFLPPSSVLVSVSVFSYWPEFALTLPSIIEVFGFFSFSPFPSVSCWITVGSRCRLRKSGVDFVAGGRAVWHSLPTRFALPFTAFNSVSFFILGHSQDKKVLERLEVAFPTVTDFVELSNLSQRLSNAIPDWKEHIFLCLREVLLPLQDQQHLLIFCRFFLVFCIRIFLYCLPWDFSISGSFEIFDSPPKKVFTKTFM